MVSNLKTENFSTRVNDFFKKCVKNVQSGCNYCWNLLRHAAVISAMWVVGAILFVLSPVLFFFRLCSNPESAAEFYYNCRILPDFKNIKSVSEALNFIDCIVSRLFCHTWRYLWSPVILILPMSVRHYFIDADPKELKDYAVQTQMDYVIYMLKSGKVFSWNISDAAFLALWNSEKLEEYRIFRAAWVASGASVPDAQIEALLTDKNDTSEEILFKYFTVKTRKDEQMNLLLDSVPLNSQSMQLIKRIVETQKPSTGFIEAVYTGPYDELKQWLRPIIDEWADVDAVTVDKANNKGALEQAKDRWKNFCRCKQKIAISAQAKMKFWHYQIFTQTDHHLDEAALKHLVATLDSEEYLELIIHHEGFDKVEAPDIMAILQSRRNFYAVYMKMKVNASGELAKAA